MAKGNLKLLGRRMVGKTPILNQTLVAGAGANTNIAVAGIRKRDYLVSVIELPAAAAATDRTATTSVTSDGNIQCTAATTGNQLLVTWYQL